MKKIAVINGVNLDRLGKREPEIYGSETLDDIIESLKKYAASIGCEILDFQSNHEGDIIDHIEDYTDMGVEYCIINPGAFTHTSVALRDAIAGSTMKFVEVHISNIYKREDFRHESLTAAKCVAVISGMGSYGYTAALDFIASIE